MKIPPSKPRDGMPAKMAVSIPQDEMLRTRPRRALSHKNPRYLLIFHADVVRNTVIERAKGNLPNSQCALECVSETAVPKHLS